jgi:hypothetical protein
MMVEMVSIGFVMAIVLYREYLEEFTSIERAEASSTLARQVRCSHLPPMYRTRGLSS